MKISKINMFIFLLVMGMMACSDDIPETEQEKDEKPAVVDPDDKDEEDKEDENNETGEYQLVWSDEFEGTGLNQNDWEIEIDGNGGGNHELQYYRAENISLGIEPVSNKNCLIITAKKESYGGLSATSGRLTTQKKRSFKYGRIEASIKLPKTQDGLWPAFWMLGNDFREVNWPKSGEIDILEMGHSEGIKTNTQDRYFNGACHWGTNWDRVGSHAQHHTWSYSLQDDDFHLYTMIWDEKAIRMYIDQDIYPDVKPYYELNITDKSNDMGVGNYFNKEFFIVLNLAVGGDFPWIHDINQITALNNGEAKMYVDFVRVYQIK